MIAISEERANKLLALVGMKIGGWNELLPIDEKSSGAKSAGWSNFKAPSDVRELFNFSLKIAEWIPVGEWKILQIDNSSFFTGAQNKILSQLSGRASSGEKFSDSATYLFQFGRSEELDLQQEYLVASFIFMFLVFELHGYLSSSESSNCQRLGLQDGFVYFMSNPIEVEKANALVKSFEANPSAVPFWAVDA
jgi:hypothetical protein